jgi:hypothetical protein
VPRPRPLPVPVMRIFFIGVPFCAWLTRGLLSRPRPRATSPSCSGRPPETPIAPISSPSSLFNATPPAYGIKPPFVCSVAGAGPPGLQYSHRFSLGPLNKIEVFAFASAMSIEPRIALSMRANAIKCPPPSTTAMFIGTPIASACEIARSTMAVASLNEMFISLFLRSMFRRLEPDVFLRDGAVAPPRHGHHPAAVLEFADHAGPVS